MNLVARFLKVIGATNPKPWRLLDREFILDRLGIAYADFVLPGV